MKTQSHVCWSGILVICSALFGFSEAENNPRHQVRIWRQNQTTDRLYNNYAYGQPLATLRHLVFRGHFYIGSPMQTLEMVVDLGFRTNHAPQRRCRLANTLTETTFQGSGNVICKNPVVVYDPQTSKTAELLNGVHAVIDVLGINPLFRFGQKALFIKNPYFDEAIFGLSPHSSNFEVIEKAMTNGEIARPVFTIFLHSCNKNICEQGGLVTFGDVDHEHCEEPKAWAHVNPYYSGWEFGIRQLRAYVTMPEKSEEVMMIGAKDSVLPVIADTGTTELVLWEREYRTLVQMLNAKHITGDRSLWADCRIKLRLTLQIGNQTLTIPADQLMQTVEEPPIFDDRVWCRVLITTTDMAFRVLGDPFTRSHCMVHDMKRKQIGFSPVKSGFRK